MNVQILFKGKKYPVRPERAEKFLERAKAFLDSGLSEQSVESEFPPNHMPRKRFEIWRIDPLGSLTVEYPERKDDQFPRTELVVSVDLLPDGAMVTPVRIDGVDV